MKAVKQKELKDRTGEYISSSLRINLFCSSHSGSDFAISSPYGFITVFIEVERCEICRGISNPKKRK